MRVPFSARPMKVANSNTGRFDQLATKPLPSDDKLDDPLANHRADLPISRSSSVTRVFASLTRFHSRRLHQSTAISCSNTSDKINNAPDFRSNSALNRPSIANSELPRLAPNVRVSATTSQLTTPLSTLSPINDLTKKKQYRGLVGLQNLGNTCFMNSCLQCVSNLPALAQHFYPTDLYALEINETSPTKGALAYAFADLIKALRTGDTFTTFRPVELKRVIGKIASRFSGFEQQDAQEFLRFLLDGLHEDLNRIKKTPAYHEIKDRLDAKDRDVSDEYWKFYLERNASALSGLFCGQLRSEICCGTCRHRSLCFDVFWDLSLPVPKQTGKRKSPKQSRISNSFSTTDAATRNTSNNGGISIHDCLKAYTEQEYLDGAASYYCVMCKRHRSVAKKISIYRLPKVLVLHFNRFSYSIKSREKVSISIDFPAQNLDISEYCAIDAVVDGSTHYDLTGIVHHVGSLNGGHYTAECLNEDTQEWFDFNDGTVKAIQKPELNSSSAYVLFYQRREERSLSS